MEYVKSTMIVKKDCENIGHCMYSSYKLDGAIKNICIANCKYINTEDDSVNICTSQPTCNINPVTKKCDYKNPTGRVCENHNDSKKDCENIGHCMYFSYKSGGAMVNKNKCIANCKYISTEDDSDNICNSQPTCNINPVTNKCDYKKTTSGIRRYISITIFILILIAFRNENFRHNPLFNLHFWKRNWLFVILLIIFIPMYITAFGSISINKGKVYQLNTTVIVCMICFTLLIQFSPLYES